MSSVIDRFLRYVQIDTRSDDRTGTSPSTAKQHNLAKVLAEELTALGIAEGTYDTEHCYVYASIPASAGCENAPALGFIAHMDTSEAVSGENVKPQIIHCYDGKEICLNPALQITMGPEQFPDLLHYVGDDLIVTDGTTLLGADDKAGVAEVMAVAEYLLQHPEIPHGKIRIGFTPDEEVGCGVDHIDLELKEGCFYGILGPNGAGKTSLVRQLLRLKDSTSGTVSLDDIDIRDIKRNDIAKKLAFLPQIINSSVDFTVQEVVAMGREPYRKNFVPLSNEDIKAIDEAMKFTDLI